MKKEIILAVAAGLFLLAYVLDFFAGPLKLQITNPIIFLTLGYFNLYPMTFVAVIARSVALMLSVALVLSLIEKQYFKKLAVCAFLTFLAEIYAFQQLATGAIVTPLLWTLSISYAGAELLILMVYYIVAGIAHLLMPKEEKEEKDEPVSSGSSFLK